MTIPGPHKFEMVTKQDIDRLLNQTALRDMQIRAFWEGMNYSGLSRKKKIEIVCQRFNTGHKNVEKIIKSI